MANLSHAFSQKTDDHNQNHKFLLHSRVLLDLRTFHSTDRFILVAVVWGKD